VSGAARRAAALATVVLATLAAAVCGATPASAAAEMVTSDPAPGTTVAGTLDAVRLTFNEPVRSPTVEVKDAAGRQVQQPPTVLGTEVVVPLSPDVHRGPVTMRWQVRTDGEAVSGDLRFTIADPVTAPAALAVTGAARTQSSADADSRANGDATSRASWAGLRGAGLVAVMLALGAGLFVVLVHDGGRDRRRLVVVTALAGVIGTGLVAGAALLGGDELSRRETVSLGLLAGGMLLVVAGAGFGGPGRPVPRAVVMVGALVAAVSFAPSGHSSTAATPLVAMGALIVHVLAMSAWLGGLVAVGLTLAHRRHVRTAQREALMLRRYAATAAIWVGAGLACGVLVAVLAMPEVTSLWHSRWGLVVAGKLAATAVVLTLAILNRGALSLPDHPGDRTRPLLAETAAFTSVDGEWDDVRRSGPSSRGLRVRIGAEAGVLALAAAVSAALVQADPGAGAREYLRVVSMGSRVAAVRSDDLTAGRPKLQVYVRTYEGRTDVNVTNLSIRFSGPDGASGPRYDLVRGPRREAFESDVELPTAGRWTMELSYRVSAVDRGEATIVLPVG
jgi:copper transport protein